MAKVRANLYLDEDLYSRMQAALKATGSSMSDYVNHAMSSDVGALELAASTRDRSQVANLLKDDFVTRFAREMESAAQALLEIQQASVRTKAGGDEKVKAKRK